MSALHLKNRILAEISEHRGEERENALFALEEARDLARNPDSRADLVKARDAALEAARALSSVVALDDSLRVVSFSEAPGVENPCSDCGEEAGQDYYSHHLANHTGERLVLCPACADVDTPEEGVRGYVSL